MGSICTSTRSVNLDYFFPKVHRNMQFFWKFWSISNLKINFSVEIKKKRNFDDSNELVITQWSSRKAINFWKPMVHNNLSDSLSKKYYFSFKSAFLNIVKNVFYTIEVNKDHLSLSVTQPVKRDVINWLKDVKHAIFQISNFFILWQVKKWFLQGEKRTATVVYVIGFKLFCIV